MWSNRLATALVSKDYHCISNHMAITESLHYSRRVDRGETTHYLRVSDNDLDRFSQLVSTWKKSGPPGYEPEIINQVSNLLTTLSDAIKAIGKKPTGPRGEGAIWWDEDCKQKHRQYNESFRSATIHAEHRKEFRATVKGQNGNIGGDKSTRKLLT